MKLLFFCLFYAFVIPDSLTKQSLTTASSLVITEIMADPDPAIGLPAQEYCEIYNKDSIPVNLAGYTFFDGSIRILPAVIINPGEYVIICDDEDTALFSGYGKYAAISTISLTNSGEKIALRDPAGDPVDSVVYSDSWFGSSIKKDGGWALEKVDVDFTCPVSNNWKPSIDPSGGSPGKINSVAGTILDDTPPILLRSYCPDSLSVVLVFSESLDPDEALLLQRYSLFPYSGIVAAVFEDAFLQRVKLTLTSPITSGITGIVDVSEITDCSGNKIEQGSQARFGLADTALIGGLVINEVLFNPKEGGYDFIELFHNGTRIIDLCQLIFETYHLETGELYDSKKISEDPWLLFPGDYLVLTENSEVVAAQYRSSFPFSFKTMENFPSMNIDEGHVAVSFGNKKIDTFHYYEDYHFELLEDFKGISLEKINPEFLSADANSWHSAAASAGFATPGFKNSQHATRVPGNNHVTLSPEIISPDNDGVDDVLTIYLKSGTPGYISNTWIYSVDGKIIFANAKNNLLATTDTFIWDGITDSGIRAPVGIYVAVVEVFNLEGAVKKYRLPFVVAAKL